MSKHELVELTVKLPKPIVVFLQDVRGNVEDFVVKSVVELAYSDVESALPELIMKKYCLEPVFKQFRCLPSPKSQEA